MAAWGLLAESFYFLNKTSGAGINVDYLSIMYPTAVQCIAITIGAKTTGCSLRPITGKSNPARKPEADTVHILVWSD